MFRRARRTVGKHRAPAAPPIPARFILARRQDGETRYCTCGDVLPTDAPLALRVHVFDGQRLRGLCDACGRGCDFALAQLAGDEAACAGSGVPRELVTGDSFLLMRVVRAETFQVVSS